jgi:hypothetical protein
VERSDHRLVGGFRNGDIRFGHRDMGRGVHGPPAVRAEPFLRPQLLAAVSAVPILRHDTHPRVTLPEHVLGLRGYEKVLYSSFVQVPQFSDWKPASVGAMVTIVGLLVLPLAIMLFMPPVKSLSLSQYQPAQCITIYRLNM